MLEKLRAAARTTFEACWAHGMEPTFERARVRSYHLGEAVPADLARGDMAVRVVDSFKHLGGVNSMRGEAIRELQNRIAHAKSAFHAYRRSVFQNRRISLRRRS